LEKSMDNQQKPRTEEFTINGEELVGKIRELVQEGNVRRVSIRTEDGRTLIEVPLTTGGAIAVAAMILAPVWAALGALAALAARVTIVVERVGEPAAKTDDSAGETKNLSGPKS
jgi:hypothetical protein